MLSLAPLAAGAAGAGAAASASALTTAASIASIASPIATAAMSANAAKASEIQANANAEIGKTRAAQTDTVSRQNLESELASMRAAIGANGQSLNAGTGVLFSELRKTRNRERRIDVSNANLQAADARMQAQGYGMERRANLIGGLVKSGPSIFDLLQTA